MSGAPADPHNPISGTQLHDERLDEVARVLVDSGARSVLDVGCGCGVLLERLLAEEQFTRMVGLDSSARALHQAERLLKDPRAAAAGRLSLVHGSFTESDAALAGFDAAVLLETLEHVPPTRLSGVERVVFREWHPRLVVITTPNREYNARLGIPEDEYRHPDHRFEWTRGRFARWATGVASRNAYELEHYGVGPSDPLLGCPTQIGVFRLNDSARPGHD